MRQRVDIREVMRLSPATVTAVSEGPTVLHRQRAPREPVTPEPVNVRNVHPAIWDAALRLCGGDVSRLNMRADGSVVITSHSRNGVNKNAQR
jgi:hypothetical protein